MSHFSKNSCNIQEHSRISWTNIKAVLAQSAVANCLYQPLVRHAYYSYECLSTSLFLLPLRTIIRRLHVSSFTVYYYHLFTCIIKLTRNNKVSRLDWIELMGVILGRRTFGQRHSQSGPQKFSIYYHTMIKFFLTMINVYWQVINRYKIIIIGRNRKWKV